MADILRNAADTFVRTCLKSRVNPPFRDSRRQGRGVPQEPLAEQQRAVAEERFHALRRGVQPGYPASTSPRTRLTALLSPSCVRCPTTVYPSMCNRGATRKRSDGRLRKVSWK